MEVQLRIKRFTHFDKSAQPLFKKKAVKKHFIVLRFFLIPSSLNYPILSLENNFTLVSSFVFF